MVGLERGEVQRRPGVALGLSGVMRNGRDSDPMSCQWVSASGQFTMDSV